MLLLDLFIYKMVIVAYYIHSLVLEQFFEIICHVVSPYIDSFCDIVDFLSVESTHELGDSFSGL